MIYKLDDPSRAAALFENWEESMIWSCLQGVMGEIYVDDVDNPRSAAAYLADFVFLGGVPCEELVKHNYGKDFLIMAARDPRWDALIAECHGERTKPITRYAIKKEPAVFDTARLTTLAEAVPEGMVLTRLDEDLYNWAKQEQWASDWVSAYPTYADYASKGLGVCLLKDGVTVAGASSYTSFGSIVGNVSTARGRSGIADIAGGIEIQIDTHKDYRRQGLATICGAALILACLERGWYPSWDAANMASVRLAEKLGYHFDHEYTAWGIGWNPR